MELTEYQLVEQFINAKRKLDKLADAKTEAQKDFDYAEGQLIERLNEQGKTATAHYDGLGYVGVVKPRVYATYEGTVKEDVFAYLRSVGRADMINEVVHPSTLSTFVKEQLEKGDPVPETISYYLKTSARFYPQKGTTNE